MKKNKEDKKTIKETKEQVQRPKNKHKNQITNIKYQKLIIRTKN